MPAVFLFVESIDLYCACSGMLLQGFHFEEMGCSMLFADIELHTAAASMVLMLLVHSVNGFPQIFLYPSIYHVLSFHLGLIATLEVSVHPTLVTFSILGWVVLFLVCYSTAVRGFALVLLPSSSRICTCSGLDGLNLYFIQLVPFCCVLLLPHVVHSCWGSRLQWFLHLRLCMMLSCLSEM